LLGHVCFRSGFVCWSGMSVSDLVLFVVAACLLLIKFCSLLRHVCC
jgi:hypothetical protein